MINFKPIGRVIGVLLIIIGFFMLLPLSASFYFDSHDEWPLIYGALTCFGFGFPLFFLIKKGDKTKIGKREGYLIVSLGWFAMVLFGMLPYLYSGVFTTIPDAFFETASGMTTTGASVLTDIEATSEGILLWRSLTQWIGGMGVIVLTVAIFPLLGIGGIELFVAESPGPTSDKIHPRIQGTAKRLWLIYVFLTAILGIWLFLAGMTGFDAINHALTTLATGGFSTKNTSAAYFDTPAIQYPLILFMFLAGTNFSMTYFGLKGKFRKVFSNEEFKAYVFMFVLTTVIVTSVVYSVTELPFEKAFRDSMFQVISLITTTGFVSADYTAWAPGLTMIFFLLLFLGGSAGSTSGSIKIIRHLVYFKNSFLEFKRMLHPRAVLPVKIDKSVVSEHVVSVIVNFLVWYMALFVFGSIVLTFLGIDFMTAIGAVATSIGNVGPGIGKVGPVDNFAWFSGEVKMVLSFLMIIGRLELFTVLVIFMPYFWRSN